MKKEIIQRLLKSKHHDDILIGLESQYQAFKHGYTNWYKREKYKREFIKRVYLLTTEFTIALRESSTIYLTLGEIRVGDWITNRLEEDFTNNML